MHSQIQQKLKEDRQFKTKLRLPSPDHRPYQDDSWWQPSCRPSSNHPATRSWTLQGSHSTACCRSSSKLFRTSSLRFRWLKPSSFEIVRNPIGIRNPAFVESKFWAMKRRFWARKCQVVYTFSSLYWKNCWKLRIYRGKGTLTCTVEMKSNPPRLANERSRIPSSVSQDVDRWMLHCLAWEMF